MPLNPIARHLRHSLGTTVREGRMRIGWSQQELADRAGMSRSMVSMVESGAVNLTVDAAGELMTPLGVAIRLHVDPPFVDGRQRDAAHAVCVGQVRRRLAAGGWRAAGEVEVLDGRARGFSDVLAYHSATRVLLVIEVKTELHDLGEVERTLNWYVRSAPWSARRLGWSPARIHGVLLLLATDANDARLHENRVLIDEAFPVRAPDLLRLLSGDEAPRGLGLAMIDPRSRRRAWLRRTRIDGRRSPLPYIDYRDFRRREGLRGQRR